VKEEEVDMMTEEVVTMIDVATMPHKELTTEFMLKTLLQMLAGKI